MEPSAQTLRKATDPEIHQAITGVYDKFEKAGRKPPNVKELPGEVKEELGATGREATINRIQVCADSDEHKKRRWKVGRTVAHMKRQAPDF
jgi:hypothetical protein